MLALRSPLAVSASSIRPLTSSVSVVSSFVRCAKTFLSVVPGKFLLFDKGTPAENMKDAERSTYTFIAEMEEGVSVSSQDLVKKNAGGASLHPGNPAEKKEEGPEDGIKVLSISGSSPSNMPPKKSAAPAAGPAFAIGEKVQALWTDGKWYTAQIKKVIPETKYQITYLEYGNTVNIESKSIRKMPAPAAAAAAPAAKAGGKK